MQLPHNTLFSDDFASCLKMLLILILKSTQSKIISLYLLFLLLQEFLTNADYFFFPKHVQMLYRVLQVLLTLCLK